MTVFPRTVIVISADRLSSGLLVRETSPRFSSRASALLTPARDIPRRSARRIAVTGSSAYRSGTSSSTSDTLRSAVLVYRFDC